MTHAVDMAPSALAVVYGLLLFPLGIVLWQRIPLLSDIVVAVLRMSVQLLFVGIYLHVVFELNNPLLNVAWVVVMVIVADVSVARGSQVHAGRFLLPLFAALLAGTALPLLVLVSMAVGTDRVLDAQYVIPISGMILGNCLRADIVGIGSFYRRIREQEKRYLDALAQGARLHEATAPFLREACRAALAPTVGTMATIGLVSLPGMMTGIILGGSDPRTAVKYQIAIMLAILCGSAITVWLGIVLTQRRSFSAYGLLDHSIFTS
jgi:putative ABC transport system permease protein